MKKRLYILITLALVSISARGQAFNMGLKLQYCSPSVIELKEEAIYKVQHRTTEFIKDSELGLLLRFNFWKMSIQPEANFSISAIWDSVDKGHGFIDRCEIAIKNMETVNLSVPILVAFRPLDVGDMFDLRLFVGPEFYTTIKGAKDKSFDISKYSLIAGVGVDLFGFLYLDFRYSHYSKGDNCYRAGIGIVF